MNIKQIVNLASFYAKKVKNREFETNRAKREIKSAHQISLTRLKNNQKAECLADAQTQGELRGLCGLRGLSGVRTRGARFAEYGRSMVEMLGVLAVIGVLSVAGIAGYQYAMNKYRANQIANELNLAGTQIALALARPHQEDFDLTLGSPFDEGTLSSGFAFTYGCGTDPQWEGCLSGDTTYYETLSGLPEDLCKTVAQLTQNLPYLTEQKVNDIVDTVGSSCNGDNNEIVMLFEIDEYNLDSSKPSEELPFIPVTYFGECSTNEDCSYGICSHGICIGCVTDADCGGGRCAKGHCQECIQDSDCPNDDIYKYNTCIDFICWPEKMAESVKCLQDSDCFWGKLCVDGHCSMCRSDADCPSNKPFCMPNKGGGDFSCTSDECNTNTDCAFIGKTTCVYDDQAGGKRCK